ncbi:hypothetical protein [Granulicella sp. dw_53]|uniref:hypothetical protein n=1 Tax=Granulicella sp. dw_53 TaxID=2719792 RepID=UPI001BD60007|nr:hypothetical protein [Granulicella sp. dw_53]
MTAIVERTVAPVADNRLHSQSIRRLKTFIWLYLLLLLFEGAVRKWIPPLSTPFLLVRDPVALLIWFSGRRLRVGSQRVWTAFDIYALTITILGLLQLIGTTLNPLVILYGWRSYVLHIPVIIVLGAFLDAKDLKTIGKWTLIISIPMTILMVAQYLAPPVSFLNRGASEGGGQIIGALGHIRPAGTFSYITGPISFVPLVAVTCIWGMVRKGLFPQWLVYSSAIATLIVIPVSVSRSIAVLVAGVIFTSALGIVIRSGISFNPDRLPHIAVGMLAGVAVVIGLAQVPLVRDAMDTFTTRWTQAQGTAGDNSALEDRIVASVTEALSPVTKVSALGSGIGAGSSVAAALNNNRLSSFEFGEGSLEREVYELGSWLGPIFVLSRMVFALVLFVSLFRSIYRGVILPWLLVVPALGAITQGSFDLATSQGFLVVIVGITIASLRMEQDAR